MSIPLTGSQSLFVRLGHIFGLVESVNTYRGTTIPPKINTLQADFSNTDQSTIEGIYSTLSNFQNSLSPFQVSMQTLAKSTIIRMANDDAYLSNNQSFPVALNYVVNQLISASATVQKCNASATVSYGGSNNGNPVIAVTTNSNHGTNNEYVVAETINGVVTSDAQSGSAIYGQEIFTFTSPYQVFDPLSWLYPVGSGISAGIRAVDGSTEPVAGFGNYLNNSSFENWTTPNIPNGWRPLVGTPGTTILQSSGSYYDGTWSLKFAGDGSELTSVYQQFGSTLASGTTTTLAPTDQLAFNVFIKVDSTPAAGAVQFSLTDSSDVPILDEQGNSTVITKSLTSVSSTWVSVNGFFRTPRVLPSAIRLKIALSTVITASGNVYFDRAALTHPYVLYPGGPSIAVFSGNSPMISGDTSTVNVYNDHGGKFQSYFDRFFGMRSLNLTLPSSNSPTISDSLIS